MRSCVQKWDSSNIQVDCTELNHETDVKFDRDMALEEVLDKIQLAIERKKVVIRNCLFVTVEFNDGKGQSIKRSYTAYNTPGNELTKLDKKYMAVFVVTDIMIIHQGAPRSKGAENILLLREVLFDKIRKEK